MSTGFDIHAFVVYLLKKFGPFEDTVDNFQFGMSKDGGVYDIVIDPFEEDKVQIGVKRREDEQS